eukprot:GFUD01014130.1.p1 GENE.GFUD01014130.1~~GFUD01014130.1.p1  ORF type:complete len:1210 (-),score=255.87 GFUD01014130.1:166-3795(-)
MVSGSDGSSKVRKAAPLYERITSWNSDSHHSQGNQYSQVDVREQTIFLSSDFHCEELLATDTVGRDMMDQHTDPDSDNEDDPTKLLNQWLGELNTLKKGLDSGVRPGNNSPATPALTKPVLRSHEHRMLDADKKQQYRCSLINLDTSQDDELDAILGELTVLESQFDQEIQTDKRGSVEQAKSCADSGDSALSPASDRSSSNITDLGIHSANHSRSSSGSDEIKQTAQLRKVEVNLRTDSPDTDSAYCDNLSVLSSCSTASSSKTGQSIGVPSSVPQLTKEEQEARIKAEKIKIAIEKIKEASVKKLFIKVFTCDGSAKSLLVDEKMTVGHVTRILAEKNHVSLDPKWALVELVPDLYMERVYEDNELLVENCLLWKVDSKNTLWFIERPEKFDLFSRPEVYLLGSSSSQKDDQMEEHSRQELLEEYFSSSGVGAPQVEGNIWLKADSKKSWKKFYFILRTSGLYYAPKGKKTSKDLVCLTTFDVNQVYYGVGWKGKYKAPSEFCFGIKHPQIQAKNAKYIKYLCVDTQKELHQWVTGIRIAKNGKNLFDNYRGIVEEITHADIDILTSKRFSVNSTSGLKILANSTEKSAGDEIPSQVLTPLSENKSLASALSSGIESDMSNVSSKSRTSEEESSEKVNVSGESIVGPLERSSGLTPVGTLERGFNLRRSFSRSSRSSSSSGCLSDKSSGFELGFESDFPVGGTIKKRPTATARLPLTSTTWGLVRETDQEMEMESGTNMSLGAGGTLLRKAVRNSLSKKSLDNENVFQHRHTDEASAESCNGNSFVGDEEPPVNTDTAHDDPLSSAFEQSMSCMLEDESLPLPPPPRVDSVTSLDDIDQLPPPPPDMCYTDETNQGFAHRANLQSINRFPESNHYHVSPVTSPNIQSKPFIPNDQPSGSHPVSGLPPPCPAYKSTLSPHKGVQNTAISTLKKAGTLQKSSRRISFDDHVQMIDAPPSPGTALPSGNIPKYSPAAPIRYSPNKLSFSQECKDNYNSLPRSFLDNLQKVMSKKWQVAEKCRANEETTPHEVLGFRDEPINKVGQPNLYSKNSAIGAWVLETQMYAHTPQYYEQEGHTPQYYQQEGHTPQYYQQEGLPPQYCQQEGIQQHPQYEQSHQPLYQVENAQPYGQYVHVSELGDFGHCESYGQYYQSVPGVPGLPGVPGPQPVVLREPEPTYVDPSRLRANKAKRPPPPPKRSENTQLSNSNVI